IDESTRDEFLTPPIYPISRHAEQHAAVVARLHEAGARATVIDLVLGSDVYAEPPVVLAESIRENGPVFLVASLREQTRVSAHGGASTYLTVLMPDSLLLAASEGACIADVEMDPDGVLRRFGPDPRLRRLGLEAVPERLSGMRVSDPVPIEFPSVDRPMPVVSYASVLTGEPEALSQVLGRIAFVGLVDDPYTDYIAAPRPQLNAEGIETFGLPGVVALAAVTETLIRGAPLRDAGWPAALLWNVAWCGACLLVLPRQRPAMAAVVIVGVIAAGLLSTGLMQVHAGIVLPAGLLLGCLFTSGSYSIITSYVGTAKRLHAEEVENARVRHEMEMARSTQEKFLPSEIPAVPGLDIWGINVSCLEVSGDYYDVLDPGEGRPIVIAIADVSGKGLPASLLMSNVQAGLHCHVAQESFDIKSTAENLNRLVHRNTDMGKFVTLFLAEIDRETHLLRYVRPGHDAPILVSGDGSTRMLTEGGLVLGFAPDFPYDVTEVQLEEGDVLCLYTDGITEARNGADEEFEVAGLAEVLVRNRERRAREIGEAVLERVRSFSGTIQQADDVTMVIVRVTG
ncbi:MAG: SpoIIE family protein phosphatase, partial [Candidatus Eisenbacteria bacterium]|nr:SpoIIE family protein phosphatase [Candidatus Eisenbacteria bacterium]